jgi:hypothetical protein
MEAGRHGGMEAWRLVACGLRLGTLEPWNFGTLEPWNPATEFKAGWSTPYEIPKKYEDLGYLSNMQDGILQICVKMNHDVIFQRFDLKKLSPTRRITFDLSDRKDHFVPDLFIDLNGQFYMIL